MLTDIYAVEAPAWLREIPAVQILRRIWIRNYMWIEGQIHWRSNEELPPGNQFINSPMIQKHAMAKNARRGGPVTSVHVTETCEKDAPHLITHVTTTAATTTDEAVTETIHAQLQQAELTPRQHLRGFWLYHGSHSGFQPTTVRDRSDWSSSGRCQVASQY